MSSSVSGPGFSSSCSSICFSRAYHRNTRERTRQRQVALEERDACLVVPLRHAAEREARFGRGDEEGSVDRALVELLDGRLALERQQSRRGLVGATRTQQRQRERARTALRSAHCDAAALQVADVVDRIPFVENPEWHVRDA